MGSLANIPYYDYNDDVFTMDNSYYNDNEYTEALLSEYESTNAVYRAMSDPYNTQ